MVREFRYWIEFTLLAAIQLFWIALSLSALFPAFAQEPKPADANPRLGAFPDQYPLGKSAQIAPQLLWYEQYRSGLANYRVFKDKRPLEAAQRAAILFVNECIELGGHLLTSPSPIEMIRVYSARNRQPVENNEPLFCIGRDGTPLGGLFAHPVNRRYYENYVALLLMQPAHVAHIIDTYHSVIAREMTLADEAKRASQDNERRWVAWRNTLAIGTETNCGPVLELRGLMALVAYTTQAGWLRRDRLYPQDEGGHYYAF